MNLLDLLFSPKGTIKPQPFAFVAIGIYGLNILAGSILDGQFVMRAGLWPYVGLQLLLSWIWFVAHKKRLADAGRGYAVAASLAFIYLIGVAIIASFAAGMAVATPDADPKEASVSLFGVIVAVLFINSLLSGDFFWIALFLFLLIGIPLLFALTVVIYSIVTGARASVTQDALPLPPPASLPETSSSAEKTQSPFS